MLVNLMPPPTDVGEVVLRTPEIVVAPLQPATGFITVHPRYRHWLAKCGIASASDALDLPGEIVSGHPNRHVLQVTVNTGTGTRRLFLKREHAVSWRVRFKNWRDGFGFVSRSEREAKVLERLEAAGLPGPHAIAHGEDGRGRAFLLVDELTGYRELRAVLADAALAADERGLLAARMGASLAELHDAGFTTPDLAAKHVFMRPGSRSTIVLDWQSSRPGAPLDTVARWEALASLDASLAEGLATPRDRLRLVKAYLTRMRAPRPDFAPFVRTIAARSRTRLRKSSIRAQRQTHALRNDQRLVWLAGEAVCAIPEIAKLWPKPAIASPYYPDPASPVAGGARFELRLADGRPATLLRFRTADPLGRLWSAVRRKSWRSPAAKRARILFHLQNAGVDAPQLYAFGQRMDGRAAVDSFLLFAPVDGAPTLDDWRTAQPADAVRRLVQLGLALRAVHDAGCVLGASSRSFRVIATRGRTRLVVDPTHGGQWMRIVSETGRVQELADILKAFTVPLEPGELETVLDAYGAFSPGFANAVRKRVAAP